MTILKLLAVAPPFVIASSPATPRRGPTHFRSTAERKGLDPRRTTAERK